MVSVPSDTSSSLLDAVVIPKIVRLNDEALIAGPEQSGADVAKWKDHLVVPFVAEGVRHAFLGPLTKLSEIEAKKEFFPNPANDQILAFGPILRTDFLASAKKVFRATTPAKRDEYFSWLDRVEAAKSNFWKQIEIYDLIQLSRREIPYNYPMLFASFFFWNHTSSSFQFPFGMASPTLFDLAAITGLSPLGVQYHPNLEIGTIEPKDLSKLTYSQFLANNKETGEVSNEEHIAFLSY